MSETYHTPSVMGIVIEVPEAGFSQRFACPGGHVSSAERGRIRVGESTATTDPTINASLALTVHDSAGAASSSSTRSSIFY